jgi:hypothetical protein
MFLPPAHRRGTLRIRRSFPVGQDGATAAVCGQDGPLVDKFSPDSTQAAKWQGQSLSAFAVFPRLPLLFCSPDAKLPRSRTPPDATRPHS